MTQDKTLAAHGAGGLNIPSRLYGRASAVDALTSAFHHVCQGRGTVLLVPGNSGSGKTSLVQEVRGEVEKRNGLFLQGKFNQYDQNIPYSAVRGVLSAFCRELARDTAGAREYWKPRLAEAIGDLGALVTDLAPELEPLLGRQPPVPEINPLESRHRFAGVLRQFLTVLCRPEHPVLLFLDDMQWADVASAELLARLHIGSALRYLLVVATYRNEEVGPCHPLSQAVEDLRHGAVPVETLEMRNLTEAEVRQLLEDTLGLHAEHIESLATLLHRHTAGNPFFTRALLTSLYDQGLLRLDGACGVWRWNAEELGRDLLPETIVRLFAQRLRQLDPEAQGLLSLAACLGNKFDLASLAMLSDVSADACRRLLQPAMADGLILPLEALPAPNEYRFLHDRVQQAAYDHIFPAELPQVRLQVGRRLRAWLSPEQLSDRVFQVADHVNAGIALIHNASEQVETLRLNVQAARKARAATAYRAAMQFHRVAAKFLQQPGFAETLWGEHHDLAHQFFLDRAESEFLEGDRQTAEECVRQAVAHAASVIEKAEALNTLIVQFTLLARYPEAIAAGREALAALGIVLPETDYEAARDAELAEIREGLRGRSVAELAELPVMTHPEMRTAARLLITMGPPCYRSHQRLWGVIVPKVVNLTIRYGNLPQIGYSHTAFGGLIGWVANDYALTKEFGLLATRLMTDTFDSPSDRSVFYLMIGSSVRHWCEPLRASSRDYTHAYQIGLASGNLQYAAYAFGHNMYCRLYQGTPLPELIQETQHSLEFSRTRVNQWAIDLLEGGLKIFQGLTAAGAGPDDDAAWEREYLRQVAAHHNVQVECIYKVNRAMTLLILGRCAEALAWSDRAGPLIYTVGTQGLLPWPEHVFVRALIVARSIPQVEAEPQGACRAELDRLAEQLRLWAGACPENFAHKQAFVAAEIARLEGRCAAALRLFREAAEGAAAAGFVHWEGLAHERAAEFLESQGQGRLAQAFWQEAYRCYEHWGATAKLRAVEAAFGEQLRLERPPRSAPDESIEQDFRQELRDEHLRQLRIKSTLTRQARLEAELRGKADELTESMDRLRQEVAERKRTEQSLRESEERYRNLILHSPDAILVNQQDRITLVNHACIRLFGARHPDQLLGKSQYDLFHPDYHPAIRERVHRMRDLGQVVPRMEEKIVRLDGKPVDVEVVGAPFPIGGLNAFHVIVRDISGRKQAEKELRRHRDRLEELVQERTAALETSEARYRQLFESSRDAILIADLNGRCLDCNAAAVAMFGYPDKQALVAASLLELSPVRQPDGRDSRECVGETMQQIVVRGSISFEWQHLRADGTEFPAEISIGMCQIEGQTVMLGILRDISDRKAAEDRLRTSEAKFRQLVERAPLPLALMNRDGSIQSINQQFTQLLGYTQTDIPHIDAWWQKAYPDAAYRDSVQAEWYAACARANHIEGVVPAKAWRVTCADGVVRSMLISGTVLEDEFLVAFLDVTPLEQVAEELRRAKEAAESASQAKSAFLANMSHELRTPMNSVLGFSQLLLRDPALSAAQRQQLTSITRAGEHLVEIINDILEMSRVESGRVSLAPAAMDLHLLLDDLERMFQLRAQAKRLHLAVQRQEGLPRCIVADEIKLRQILINLLSNAVKFTPKDGEITLRAHAEQEPGGPWRVYAEVEDNGVGIGPTDLPRLFEPFFQTETGKEMAGGTGLGLAISRKFARLMGGDLTVNSQLGRGSVFRLVAQVQRADDAAVLGRNVKTPEIRRLAPGNAPCRVLVADDHEENLELIERLLVPLGFEVLAAKNGLEAVVRCRAWSPQLVMMDLRMPVLNGYDAARQIRAAHGSAVKILAVSANVFAEDEQEALDAGMDAFLPKPFHTAELLERIKQLTGVEYIYESPAAGKSVAERPDAAANVAHHAVAASGSPPPLSFRGRVLVAEDDPGIQHLLRILLGSVGVECQVVDDGEQACRQALASTAEGRPYDLILMDVHMPNLGGLEATARLREQGWKGPIVALTGRTAPEDRQRCLDAGYDHHLSKPFSGEDFDQLLAHYLRPTTDPGRHE